MNSTGWECVICKIRIRKEKSSVAGTLFSDPYLTVVNNTFCSPTDVNVMQPSRVADFGALAQSAGFRIEDFANFVTSMCLCSQSTMLLVTYLLQLFSSDFSVVHFLLVKNSFVIRSTLLQFHMLISISSTVDVNGY
jgi:hypothetical protein